jgi:hypothetical protein
VRVNPLGDPGLGAGALEHVADVGVAKRPAVQGAEQGPAAEAELAALIGPALQDGQGAVIDADRPCLAALARQDADRARRRGRYWRGGARGPRCPSGRPGT